MIRKESTPSLRAQAGFTLIELLVVIAIIAVLSAILFPVFAQAKTAAKTTATASGLRQIGMASILYSNDYDEVVVSTQANQNDDKELWAVCIRPYAKTRSAYYDPTRVAAESDIVKVLPTTSLPWYQTTTFAINEGGYAGGWWTTSGNTCSGRKAGYNFDVRRNMSAMNEPERRVAFVPNTWGGTQYGWHFVKITPTSGAAKDAANWIDASRNTKNAFTWSNQVWDTRDLYSGGSIPIVHADGSIGKLRRKDFIDQKTAPDLASYCRWVTEVGQRTWGPFWTPS